ncbi:putative virion structural protein [Pseudomonas phage OBP]|uniref:putative virion structural protein n=1 Tax=Pseudomonas phage OBP TaxID=1124849 RepID=UPI000240D562|nr:putative virion structural protein [Pseudomonas phage OBP]AEV89578.1 putative virion structural protein [Pseudomonas phage OBP]
MYTYKYSTGRYKNYRPGYHPVDIKGYSVADLEKMFDILYITVRDEMFNSDVTISLEDYRLEFAEVPQYDIEQWLQTQNGNNLKPSDITPGDKYSYVKLERIFTYGYFHYPADLNLAKDRQDALLADSAPDIRVSHYRYQNIDYNKINDYSLFTVNGVFVRSVGRSDGVYLLGAGTDYIANRNDIRIGALNFQKLGKVKTIPFDKDKLIETETTSGKLWEYKLDENISSKTAYVVVNGQLLVDPEIVSRTADDRLTIDLTAFDVCHHFLNYRHYTRTPKLTNLTKFDNYKKEALLSHNSFIVLIDNPSLGVDVVPLTTFRYPNVLHTEDRFQHPVLLENGMFPVPYLKSYGIKQRLINHDLRIYRFYPFMTDGTKGGQIILNDATNPGNVGRLQRGYTFKIHGVELRKA